jgi:N-acetyl-D-muramate 6-phosphate phosphatase
MPLISYKDNDGRFSLKKNHTDPADPLDFCLCGDQFDPDSWRINFNIRIKGGKHMPLEIERIDALCFDVDGTISDTDDRYVDKLGRFLLPFRWLLPRDPFSTARSLVMTFMAPGNLLYHWADRLGLDDRIAQYLLKVGRKERRWYKQHWIIPGVKDCLKNLENHFPMSVVSARDERSTIHFLEQFQLMPFFKSIVTGQTCKYTKPFPDPVIFAAEEMNVPPENCLMIGDTTVDIKAGRRAGAQTVGVLCGFGSEKALRKAGADLILPSTAHLQYVLKKDPADIRQTEREQT